MSRLRVMQMSAEELERRQKDGTMYADLVPIGKWIEHEQNGVKHLECDQCGVWFLREHLVRNSFCPNCGADMRSAEQTKTVFPNANSITISPIECGMSEWIPVSERLPEKNGYYLVSGKWHDRPEEIWICECMILGDIKGWCNPAKRPIVEAWMPLPEPYKGD